MIRNLFFCHSLRYCQLGPKHLLWLLINETVLKQYQLKKQYRCVCGHEDWSTQSFDCNLNPIQTRGRQIMPTICWCPHQVLKATCAPADVYCSFLYFPFFHWSGFLPLNVCAQKREKKEICSICISKPASRIWKPYVNYEMNLFKLFCLNV